MSNQHRKALLVTSLAVWAAVALSACASLPKVGSVPPTFVAPAATAGVSGSLVHVARGEMTVTIAARGRVTAADEVSLSFPVMGALKTLAIRSGQQVKKGDLLAEIDVWDLETDVFNAQNDVQAAQARLEQARAMQAQRIAAAQANLSVVQAQAAASALSRDFQERQIQQGKVPHGSPEEYLVLTLRQQAALDEARVAQAQAELASARVGTDSNSSVPLLTEGLRLAQARLERLQSRLETTRLRAPFDGVVLSLSARVGDGLDAYQPIGIMADPSHLTIVANVFEDAAAGVFVGQAAAIKLDAVANRTFAGEVSQIALRPILWQGKNAYEVTLAFDNPTDAPASIRQGADVMISAQHKQNVLLLPNGAIVAKNGQSFVEVVENGGATRLAAIQLGASDGTHTEVIAGLREGDTIKLP